MNNFWLTKRNIKQHMKEKVKVELYKELDMVCNH